MSNPFEKPARRVYMASLIGNEHIFRPEGYRVLNNKQGPWLRRWMIRKMWQWLENCGALQPYETLITTYSYGDIEREKVQDLIRPYMDEVLHGLAHDPSKRAEDYAVCIGAAEFSDIMQGMVASRTMTVDGGDWYLNFDNHMAPPMHSGPRYHSVKIQNLPVHVVPSMSGVAIIPRVVIEKQVEPAAMF